MKICIPKLPQEFADIDQFVQEWSLSFEQARAVKRLASSIDELRTFHSAMFPRLDAIIDYLNRFPNDPSALPADARALYDLALMAMEAAAPIDLGWDGPDIDDVFPLERFQFTSEKSN
ncbi:MAG: hypothetical protein ACKVOY_16405 [Burkholderiaceae bacterium]